MDATTAPARSITRAIAVARAPAELGSAAIDGAAEGEPGSTDGANAMSSSIAAGADATGSGGATSSASMTGDAVGVGTAFWADGATVRAGALALAAGFVLLGIGWI